MKLPVRVEDEASSDIVLIASDKGHEHWATIRVHQPPIHYTEAELGQRQVANLYKLAPALFLFVQYAARDGNETARNLVNEIEKGLDV